MKQHTLLVRSLLDAGWTISFADTSFRPLAATPPPPIPGFNRYFQLLPATTPTLPSPPHPTLRPPSRRFILRAPDPNALLANHVHIILLGTEGYLYRPLGSIISTTLQVPHQPLSTLLRTLCRHAIQYLHALVRCRRALDFSASDASIPPPHYPMGTQEPPEPP